MTISEIKQYLKERGIDLNTRIDRNGGGQYLYGLLTEFNDKVKRESKDKIIKHIERFGLED
jgi:myo-inositol-1-phosphate synthase